jgi:polar amino acid transport system substrate-binding protein
MLKGLMNHTRRAAMLMAMGAAAAALVAHSAAAQTVDEIKKRGTINIGVLSGEPPWGFTNEKGEPVGVDIDVSQLLARDMGVKIKYEPMTVTSRIPSLLTGKVDILVASMGMFPDRAKVVQFSRPYVANVNLVVAGKDKPIATYADLKGYRVAVNRGNVIDIAVTQNAPPGTQILRFDDDASAVQALRAGQADAVGLAIYPLKMLDKSAPGHNFEKKIVVNNQWTGVAMRKDQKDLNTWINAFLDKIEQNGELNAISRKWLDVDHPQFPKSLPDIPFTVN